MTPKGRRRSAASEGGKASVNSVSAIFRRRGWVTAWAMRRTIYERDVLSEFRKRLLPEIAPENLRALCAKVKDRGAPATAIHTAISASRSTGSPFCARYVVS